MDRVAVMEFTFPSPPQSAIPARKSRSPEKISHITCMICRGARPFLHVDLALTSFLAAKPLGTGTRPLSLEMLGSTERP